MFSGVGKFRSSQRLPEGFDSGGIFSFLIERLASRYPIAPTFSVPLGDGGNPSPSGEAK
jgi:hypothetical protein